MKNFKEAIKETIIVDGEIDVYNLSEMVINWPNTNTGETIVKVDYDIPEDITDIELEEDIDFFNEPQDLENWEILTITDDKMIMCCGGDWQEPMKITIELVDGKLTVTETENGIFEEGLDYDEILHILTK